MKWGTKTVELLVRGGGAPPTPPPRTELAHHSETNRCALAFNGTYEHSLDVKKRLTVPSRFRASLAGKVVVVKGVDACLTLYPQPVYDQFTEAAMAGLNPFTPRAREVRRLLFGNAVETALDSAGRVVVPAKFLEHAGIDREVVLTGTGDGLEIWDRATWNAYDADLTARGAEVTAALGHPA